MPDLYPKPFRWAVSWMIVAAVVFAAVSLSCSGCVSAAAIKQARTEQAVNRVHANDQGLSANSRSIGEDNYDAWSSQLYNLIGERLPADVVKRLQGRGQLPGGYEVGE